MCKLDRSSGILFDHASIALRSVGKSAIVFDELPAPLRYARVERTLTVDAALKAAHAQRVAVHPLEKLIPGIGRLR